MNTNRMRKVQENYISAFGFCPNIAGQQSMLSCI